MLCRLCLRVIIVRQFRGEGIERVAKIEHTSYNWDTCMVATELELYLLFGGIPE